MRPTEVGWSPVTDLALSQGDPLAATTMPALGTSGKIDLRNEHGRIDVAIDVAGYFVGGA